MRFLREMCWNHWYNLDVAVVRVVIDVGRTSLFAENFVDLLQMNQEMHKSEFLIPKMWYFRKTSVIKSCSKNSVLSFLYFLNVFFIWIMNLFSQFYSSNQNVILKDKIKCQKLPQIAFWAKTKNLCYCSKK